MVHISFPSCQHIQSPDTMPLVRWNVVPENISEKPVPPDIQKDHLDCVSNNTLAAIVQQLSTLSHFADDIFSGLISDTDAMQGRTSRLVSKLQELEKKMQQLDVKTDGSCEQRYN